jgi:SRSO17 transposase
MVYLGMAQYETRSWVGWHHHMTLVGLAHLFVTVSRLRLKKKQQPDTRLECRGFLKMLQIVSWKGLAPTTFAQA